MVATASEATLSVKLESFWPSPSFNFVNVIRNENTGHQCQYLLLHVVHSGTGGVAQWCDFPWVRCRAFHHPGILLWNWGFWIHDHGF